MQSNGYVTAAQSCADCRDNLDSREAQCRSMIDCLAPLWPCTGCFGDCLNVAHGNDRVGACVRAMTASACGSAP